MKAQELKKILEVPFEIKKGFAPITQYICIDKNTIKATDLESYSELYLDEPFPFIACVLRDQLKKFLSVIDKDTDLDFEINQNTLVIKYNKKNKFIIPIESVSSFPESPYQKYTEDDKLFTINLTPEFIADLKLASEFVGIDYKFNGIYLIKDKIYSSNRSIIFSCSIDYTVKDTIFLPIEFIKFIFKFPDVFTGIEVYKSGLKAVGGVTLYHPTIADDKEADFEAVFYRYESIVSIQNNIDLKEVVNRTSNFGDMININIKNNYINIFTNTINETIESEDLLKCDQEYEFKFNPLYLKKMLDICNLINLTRNKNDKNMEIQAIMGNSDKYKIVGAIII